MQKKFIDITMQHLVNKYVIIIMTVSLMSCSHIVYDEDQNSENSDEEVYVEEYSAMNPPQKKYKEIYCTPEDEKKGIKATIDNLYVACGRSKIQPIKSRTLEIKRIFLGVEKLPSGDLLLGHHLLILKAGDKILQKVQVEKEGYDPFWREVVFVKIRKGVYWQDLNNDGYPEFAMLKTDTGNAIYRRVDRYTLKGDSFHFYGYGKYVWHTGQHVLLNCMKCWKFDLDECKKCT